MISCVLKMKANDAFMKYFRNTSWLFLEKIFRIIVGLLVGFWVIRYLGPERFGLLSYSQSFVGLFMALSTLGLDGIVVREIVKDEEKRDKIVGTAFLLKLFGAVAVIIAIAVSFEFTSNETNNLMLIIACATIFQSFNVIDFYFQAKVLSRFIVYINIVSVILSSIAKIVCILVHAPVICFAYIIVFDSFVLALGFICVYVFNGLSLAEWRFDKFIALSLLKDSWPLVFGTIAASIYMQIDQVMLKEYMGSSAVGYYAVSSRLSEIWLFITVLVTKSLVPSIINAKKQSKELFYYRIQYLYNLLVKIAFFISVIICIFAEDIVVLLFGEQYLKSAPILIVYVWSIIFVYISNASTSYFLAENMQFHASMRLIVGAIMNIVLNILWIKAYGLNGAAYATLCSYAFSSYIYNLMFRKTRINFIMQTKSIINIFNVFSYKQLLQIK